MIPSLQAAAAFALPAILAAGCGVGLMQTARTTPEGTLDVQVAAGYAYNHMVEERGNAFTNFPVQLGLRYGLSDRLDLGLGMFMGAGGLADAKVNLMPADHPLAAAVQAGFGAAYDIGGSQATVLHLPVRALVSRDFLGGELTPYAGVGFGLFWILGYNGDEQLPSGELADRAGHGDGLLMLSVGLEILGASDPCFFVEYTWWKPVLDDPGDRFAFAQNHFFLGGVRF